MDKSNENEERKDRAALLHERKKIMNNLVLLFAASFVVLIGALTMAWFAMNKTTGANGMGTQVSDVPFALKTIGYYGYFDDWLDEGVGKISEDRAHAETPPSGSTSVITTNQSATIQWLITEENNVKNYVTENTVEDDIGIRPGSFGSLKFRVIPKGTEVINLDFKLDMIPYRTVYQTDGSGTVILDGEGHPTELRPEIITGNNDAVTYLKNHVLFFKERSGTLGNYVYSGLIDLDETVQLIYLPSEDPGEPGTYTSTLTFDKVGDELQEKEITIYWIWPETLAEAALKGNQQTSGATPVCGSENLEIFNKLKANPSNFLAGYNNTIDTDGVANSDLTQTIIKNHYSKLSLEYNNADQMIGDNIGYIVLRLTATTSGN